MFHVCCPFFLPHVAQIAKALKPWMFKGGNKGFGVSAVLIVRETGANVSFNAFMDVYESTPLPSQQRIFQPGSFPASEQPVNESPENSAPSSSAAAEPAK